MLIPQQGLVSLQKKVNAVLVIYTIFCQLVQFVQVVMFLYHDGINKGSNTSIL